MIMKVHKLEWPSEGEIQVIIAEASTYFFPQIRTDQDH